MTKKGPPPGFEKIESQNGSSSTGMKKGPLCCRNCGYIGHIYKECKFPIMSYGLICYRIHTDGSIQYLMVQRKDSLAFMEFIRGKYDPLDIQFITNLLTHMTIDERDLIRSKTFQELWNIVWHQTFVPRQTHDYYKEASEKFEKMKRGFYHTTQQVWICLEDLLNNTSTAFNEPEWGFPKGRRYLKESDLECAIREFCEETTYPTSSVRVVSPHPYEETFYGTNGILYRHSYYIACMDQYDQNHKMVDPGDTVQAREIRDVSWCTTEEVLTKIRPYNQERRSLFRQVHTCVCELHSLWNRQNSPNHNQTMV